MSGLRVLALTAAQASAVPISEYTRLLGLPREWRFDEASAVGAADARGWYATHARPWVAVRRIERIDAAARAVPPDGTGGEAAAHAVLACVATAGAEVDAEVERHWQSGRPDAAFFLERLAAAVVERLVRLAWSAGRRQTLPGEALLPHRSPGCGDWPLAAQVDVMALLANGGDRVGSVHLLPSGALFPKNSLLAVAGIARRQRASAAAHPSCRGCRLPDCAYRRRPGRAA